MLLMRFLNIHWVQNDVKTKKKKLELRLLDMVMDRKKKYDFSNSLFLL